MTCYTFNKHTGPDFAGYDYTLDAFEAHESAETAAYAMLGYDCRRCGVEEKDGEFVPWRQRASGMVERLTNLTALTEAEAIANIISSPHFDIECVNEETALKIIQEASPS